MDLKKGQSARIIRILQEQISLHFLEMGFYVGSVVTFLEEAPFEGPIYLSIYDNYLCIRKESAALMEVDVI